MSQPEVFFQSGPYVIFAPAIEGGLYELRESKAEPSAGVFGEPLHVGTVDECKAEIRRLQSDNDS